MPVGGRMEAGWGQGRHPGCNKGMPSGDQRRLGIIGDLLQCVDRPHPHLWVAATQLLYGSRETISDLPRPGFTIVYYSHQNRCKRSDKNTCEAKNGSRET